MVLLGLLCAAGTAWGARWLYYNYDPQPVIATDYRQDIGGWLYLFAFGLFIRPLLHLVQILGSQYFDGQQWEVLTSQTSATYNPTLAALLVAELFYNIAMIGFSIIIILLFVRHRSSVPNLVTILYAVSIVFVSLSAYLVWDMKLLSAAELKSGAKELVQLIISGAIGVPYFHLSQRAKGTFVETLRVPEDQQEIYRPNF
jgi:hypothetical protein